MLTWLTPHHVPRSATSEEGITSIRTPAESPDWGHGSRGARSDHQVTHCANLCVPPKSSRASIAVARRVPTGPTTLTAREMSDLSRAALGCHVRIVAGDVLRSEVAATCRNPNCSIASNHVDVRGKIHAFFNSWKETFEMEPLQSESHLRRPHQPPCGLSGNLSLPQTRSTNDTPINVVGVVFGDSGLPPPLPHTPLFPWR